MKRIFRSWWSPVVFAFALTGAAGLACSDARAADPGLDTTLPRLTAFTMPATADVAAPGADARFTWSRTDASGSGVSDGYGWVIGPSGRIKYFWIGNGVAANKVASGRATLPTGRYLSTAFGGTTDFAPIFDTTTVALTP